MTADMLDPDEILAGLDFEFTEPVMITSLDQFAEGQDLALVVLAGQTFDLTALRKDERAKVWNDVRQWLLREGQMHARPEQRTEEGKLLHSVFLALQIAHNNDR